MTTHGAGLSPIDYWRLCDELTIVQAALLLVGNDPANAANVELWDMHDRPLGYEAARSALTVAVLRKGIESVIVPVTKYYRDGEALVYADSVDPAKSRLNVDSLRLWLRRQGITSGFFLQGRGAGPDYLNPEHPRYAPKLAAAVRAWIEVDDPQGKSPKAALSKWLRENAKDFGLCDDEGKPNEQGIEECAKVANWQPGGGAPKTPGG